jgi:uncharacterized coiled-coil DUF342 family protein
MATNAEDGKSKRIQEIEQEIAQHRAQIKRSQESIDKMRKEDPEMLADAGAREDGRINSAQEAIKRLEDELRSLQQA